MSNDLYKTMLYFDGRKVIAKSEGVGLELMALPTIESLPKHTTELYFFPSLRDYRLRESAQAIRDMNPPEIAAVVKFLASIAAIGRRLLGS